MGWRFHANFTCWAASWHHALGAVAMIKWHPGEHYPRMGFVVTDLRFDTNYVAAYYDQRRTVQQWIEENRNSVKWPRLSCRMMQTNAVRFRLYVLNYNLATKRDPS